MNNNYDVFAGVLRHILTIAAGILVSQGYTDESTATAAVAGIVAVLTIFWSIKSKGTK